MVEKPLRFTRRRRVVVGAFAVAAIVAATVSASAFTAGKAKLAITPSPAFTGAQLGTPAGNDWITTGGNIQSWHYSTLNQITKDNVSQLKLAWTQHLGACQTSPACGGEGNALEYQGVVYMPSGADTVMAMDATTGQTLWNYVPTPPPADQNGRTFTQANYNGVNRGIAMGQGMIFVGQKDAALVALDQTTGGVIWRTQVAPWEQAYEITSSPIYWNGEVIIGMSGGDGGNRDFISAYDANNGEQLWRWYATPAPGDPALKTWGYGAKTFEYAGGAMFDTPILDPTTGQVFVGTGNPEPWNSRPPGQELYVDSIVSLNALTGSMDWYYQTVNHDIWDDDIPDPGVIVTGKWRNYKIIKPGTWVDDPSKGWSGSYAVGQKIKYTSKPIAHRAVVYPSKQGFTFILDEKTGKPLIPTPEMTIKDPNAAEAAGMGLAKTEPIPVGDYWAAQCVLPTQWTQTGPDGKPVVHGCAYTPYNTTQFVAIPHDEGEWQPPSYNPTSNSIGLCLIDNRAWAFEAIPPAQVFNAIHPGAGATGVLSTHGNKNGYSGRILSQNVLTNKTIWADNQPDWCYSGSLQTASGLMFVGHTDGSLAAYDASTGQQLWRGPTEPSSADAPSITYMVNGKQYVTILAGGNNHENDPRGDLVETFTLP